MTGPGHVLETGRLVLVPTRAEHAGGLWNAIERSLPELARWMSWAPSSTPQTVAEYAHRAENGWVEWTNWDWVVHLGDDVAGTVGLNRYDDMWRSCNLGYWIRSDLIGRGFATEAAADPRPGSERD